MFFGVTTFSEVPFGGLPSGTGFSEETPFSALLNDFSLQRVYLLELTGTNFSPLYLSDCGYNSGSNIYEGRLENPFNFETKLFDNNSLIGSSRVNFGNITILNSDGALDGILNDNWDVGSVTLKMGTKDFDYSDFGVIFKGKVEQATWNEKEIILRLRNSEPLLDKPIQTNTYLGTGGLEGTDNLTGIPKPLCYGKCSNISPIGPHNRC